MRSSGGAAASAAGGAATISATVRETIKSIREITGKQHSDEDIYTVLKDCSMDPNETAQKLLYLDTFHEVKRKKDKKKEISQIQGRGARASRGNYSANHNYSDGLFGRNAGPRRENGIYHLTQKGSSTSTQATQRTINMEAASATKASNVMTNGTSSLTNWSSTLGNGSLLHADGVINAITDSSVVDVKKQDIAPVQSTATRPTFDAVVRGVQGKPTSSSNGFHSSSAPGLTTSLQSSAPHPVDHPTFGSVVKGVGGKSTSSSNGSLPASSAASASGVYASATDPILAPSTTRNPGTLGTIKRELGSQPKVDELNLGNGHVSDEIGSQLPKNETDSLILDSLNRQEVPSKVAAAEDNNLAQSPQLVDLATHDESLASKSMDSQSPRELVTSSQLVSPEEEQAGGSPQSPPEPTIPNGYVTFPNHFIVPEALRNGLTFGSFDANPGIRSNSNNCNGCEVGVIHAVESLQQTDETTGEPHSSKENGSLTMQVDQSDESDSSHHVLENASQLEVNVVASADSKDEESKQETVLIPDSQRDIHVQMAPNFGFGIVPPVQGGHLVHLENHETQKRDVSRLASYAAETPAASSSPSLAPPVQPIMFRPPYHPNYLQYGPYFSPYILQPMHQFLSHNALPQQSSNGNAYLASSTSPKFPLPQFKPGSNAGNPAPLGLPPLYGSYSSSPMGFNPGSAMTSVNSNANEELSASQLKESHIYTTGPLSEISAWIPQQGQDITSLQLNSVYHLPPQGQHLPFSPQAGHSPFSGLYPPVQTIPAPSTVNPLLQQSQSMTAPNETVGLPPGAYQQPQLAHINWNSSY